MLCLTLILSLPPPAAQCAPLLLLACVLALPAPHLTRSIQSLSPFNQSVLNNTVSALNTLVNGRYVEGLHLCQQDTARTTPEWAVGEGIFQPGAPRELSAEPQHPLKRDTCPSMSHLPFLKCLVGPCSHRPFCSCVGVEAQRVCSDLFPPHTPPAPWEDGWDSHWERCRRREGFSCHRHP